MQETSPAAPDPPPTDKHGWRREFRRRLALTPDPAADSRALSAHLRDFLAALPPRSIATFAALPGEPRILDLIDALTDHRWCLPRIDGDILAFHRTTSVEDLRPGRFKILEPTVTMPVTAVAEIDIFLCPGLCFGLDGSRLGRGRGFYDRALALARPGALRVGIAFAAQITPHLPCDPHDSPMTHLITPEGLIEIRC